MLAVAGAALAAGHDVDLVDCMFAPTPVGALRAALAPSATTWWRSASAISTTASGRRRDTSTTTSACWWKRRGGCTTAPLVLGGSGFSVEPQGWLSRLDVDYGVVGEGEAAFVALLAALAAGRSGDGIPGVTSRDRHRAAPARDRRASSRPSRPRSCPSIETLAPPAHQLLDYRPYIRRGGFVSVQAKRGCAFKCEYCVYPQLEGTRYRNRPVEAIVDEMADVVRTQGVRQFFFADSVFNMPRAHTLDLCHADHPTRLDVRWMAYTNSARFDDELAHAMVAAGCLGIEFGLDAVTEKMLHNWRKPFRQRDIRRSLQACHDARASGRGAPALRRPRRDHRRPGREPGVPRRLRARRRRLRVARRTHLRGRADRRTAREEGVIDDDTDLFFPTWYVSPGLGPEADAHARRDRAPARPLDHRHRLDEPSASARSRPSPIASAASRSGATSASTVGACAGHPPALSA